MGRCTSLGARLGSVRYQPLHGQNFLGFLVGGSVAAGHASSRLPLSLPLHLAGLVLLSSSSCMKETTLAVDVMLVPGLMVSTSQEEEEVETVSS
eukprot:CAMPEP_0183301232 /NCGR_PEP_ID=MMETSP0160_2-20130417/7411_1 /TAXON_ID=2839 ORGANISM="Odontella Sinensis, Strain Grunow 1884" /NCGR_SAMPLE_ID=MMETSP0160_2 /ASSEMBLY_ACC=CAM_ASM_000250 /LENGTH=93 /DNA_ID=CAMNT_0025463803 /DNA_START=444 /DNA_END=722 /DNA_ORIENTATION=-